MCIVAWSKKKKYIYIYIYFIQPDLIVSIFYSFYQIRSFIHSDSHSLNVAGPTIVNVTAIVKFRPTLPICLRRTSLPQIHFRSVVSVFFMWCFGFGFWFGYNILFRQSAYPLWVFDLDPLHVDVSVFDFWLLFWIIRLEILCYEISFCFVLVVLSW